MVQQKINTSKTGGRVRAADTHYFHLNVLPLIKCFVLMLRMTSVSLLNIYLQQAVTLRKLKFQSERDIKKFSFDTEGCEMNVTAIIDLL